MAGVRSRHSPIALPICSSLVGELPYRLGRSSKSHPAQMHEPSRGNADGFKTERWNFCNHAPPHKGFSGFLLISMHSLINYSRLRPHVKL